MVDKARLEPVLSDLRAFRADQDSRHTLNFRANWCLIILALLASAAAIIGGVLKWPHETIAIIGVVGTGLVALQASLAIADKAEFQRVVVADADNIIMYLQDPAITDEGFEKLRDQFAAVRKAASEKLPKGGGVEAARKLPPVEKPT